jgi:hypothetical protein
MTNEPSGAIYDYTLTMKPERPWLVDYHLSLVYKTMNANKDAEGNLKDVHLTFEQTLEVIERFDNMILGMPQVLYLTGWQYNGHDSKYPAWEEANAALKRDEDATALESLRWLIREARQRFDARVSLHVNMMDAYPESPYWEAYLAKDVVAKDLEGNPIACREWGGMMAYALSYTQEWKLGLAQKRIDGLLNMIPELADTGTIHVDAFLGARQKDQKGPISPYLGYSKAQEAETMRKMYRYWRDKGVDVTSEWAFGLRDDRFVGLQPWCWHQEDQTADLPNALYCSTKFLGSDMWLIENRLNPPHAREKFYLEVLPWYYNNHADAQDDSAMVEGSDICMPALWCATRTIIAYSQNGYASKTWALPADWHDVACVSIARITLDGSEPIGDVAVVDGRLSLRVEPNESLAIRPSLD